MPTPETSINISWDTLIAFGSPLASFIAVFVADWIKQKNQTKATKELQVSSSKLNGFIDRINHTHNNKLELYKLTITPLSIFINELETITNEQRNPYELMSKFYPLRIEILAQVSLFSPVEVFNAYEALLNYLFLVIRGDETYSLNKIEDLGEYLLNLLRKDIGLYNDQIHFDRMDQENDREIALIR